MAEEIDNEKSFPTNPNMACLTFAKAEKMAFDVCTSGKRKKIDFFFDFRRKERVKQYLLIQQVQKYGFMS